MLPRRACKISVNDRIAIDIVDAGDMAEAKRSRVTTAASCSRATKRSASQPFSPSSRSCCASRKDRGINHDHPARDKHDSRHLEKHLLSLSLVGATMPPQDPNDDEDEEDEEDGGDADDDREPAVIREPDEDMNDVQREEQQTPRRDRADPVYL
jgi:hypothetical protein